MVPIVFCVEKFVVGIVVPLQTDTAEGWFTWADGLIVIVKVFGIPAQLKVPTVKVGVTVIVAVKGLLVVLVAVKFKFPVPEDGNPMALLSFVQL